VVALFNSALLCSLPVLLRGNRITRNKALEAGGDCVNSARLNARRMAEIDKCRNLSADVLTLGFGNVRFSQSDGGGPETSQAERVVCAIPIGSAVGRDWQRVNCRSTIPSVAPGKHLKLSLQRVSVTALPVARIADVSLFRSYQFGLASCSSDRSIAIHAYRVDGEVRILRPCKVSLDTHDTSRAGHSLRYRGRAL